jgi:hypothetical protein
MVALYDTTPEDREIAKRAATRRRTMVLGVITLIAIVIRVAVKNPPPPKSPDHAGEPFRALPGMLQNIPESERAKLSPDLLAKMQEADLKARTGRDAPATALAHVPATSEYRPAAAPVDIRTEEQKLTDTKFKYASRRKTVELQEPISQEDFGKDKLVVFSRGGYIRVESAERAQGFVDIRLDRTSHALVPQKIVRSISTISLPWTEPVPAGQVKLKPARGITITIDRASAKRISITKAPHENKTPKI